MFTRSSDTEAGNTQTATVDLWVGSSWSLQHPENPFHTYGWGMRLSSLCLFKCIDYNDCLDRLGVTIRGATSPNTMLRTPQNFRIGD